MQFDRVTFKYVAEHSGFTKAELATLYGVSRQHIYSLMKLARPHNQNTVRLFNIYSVALNTLIDRGLLPLGYGTTTREARIKTLIAKLYDLARPK